VDACLRDLFDAAEPSAEVALVALGGYGRGMLSPGSDVDLLILHEGTRPDDVFAVAERLLYPMWDVGLRVGHAVRTADQCVEVAAERLDACTAMLDGRVVAGSQAWTARVWRSSPVAVTPRVRGAVATDRQARCEYLACLRVSSPT
jgi:[protein-PII] uridylyltransferase